LLNHSSALVRRSLRERGRCSGGVRCFLWHGR
jgi:hypothetical protein